MFVWKAMDFVVVGVLVLLFFGGCGADEDRWALIL